MRNLEVSFFEVTHWREYCREFVSVMHLQVCVVLDAIQEGILIVSSFSNIEKRLVCVFLTPEDRELFEDSLHDLHAARPGGEWILWTFQMGMMSAP